MMPPSSSYPPAAAGENIPEGEAPPAILPTAGGKTAASAGATGPTSRPSGRKRSTPSGKQREPQSEPRPSSAPAPLVVPSIIVELCRLLDEQGALEIYYFRGSGEVATERKAQDLDVGDYLLVRLPIDDSLPVPAGIIAEFVSRSP